MLSPLCLKNTSPGESFPDILCSRRQHILRRSWNSWWDYFLVRGRESIVCVSLIISSRGLLGPHVKIIGFGVNIKQICCYFVKCTTVSHVAIMKECTCSAQRSIFLMDKMRLHMVKRLFVDIVWRSSQGTDIWKDQTSVVLRWRQLTWSDALVAGLWCTGGSWLMFQAVMAATTQRLSVRYAEWQMFVVM